MTRQMILSLSLSLVFIFSCTDNFMKSKVRDRSTHTSELLGAVDASGNFTASMDPNSTTTQTMRATSGTIAGSAIAMPVGALSIPVSVSIGEGANLTSSSTAAQIGLSGNAATAAGPSVSFVPSTSVQASSPFTLSIPASTSSSLFLDGPMTSSENLIVIYRWMTVDNGTVSYSVGILPRSELTVGSKSVQFQTTKFGTFQLAVTQVKVVEKIEKPTEFAPVLKSGVKPPTSVTYAVANPTYFLNVPLLTANLATVAGGAANEFTIAPTPPTGLVFDTRTGAISGTPTVEAPTASYTITAQNDAGSTSVVMNLQVVRPHVDPPVSSITVDVTSATPTVFNTWPLNVSVTFSESVTGFDSASDIAVTNGSVYVISGSGSTYNVSITPTGEGAVSVAIPPGVALNSAGSANLASNVLTRVYDVTPPVFQSAVVIGGLTGTSTTPTITGTLSEASVVSLYLNNSACTGTAASTAVADGVFSSTGIPLTSPVPVDTSSVIYGKAIDPAGNVSCSNLLTYTHVSPAVVTNVSSTMASGLYGIGATIGISVVFSKSVYVTGTPQLTLETGVNDAVVNYSGGTGSSTLNFNYTVSAGDTSAHLDYVGIASLVLNSGMIKDSSGINAILTLPTPGTINSLGYNRNFMLDTVVPTISLVQLYPASGDSAAPKLNINLSEASATNEVRLFDNNTCTSSISDPVTRGGGFSDIFAKNLPIGIQVSIYAQVKDIVLNASACTFLANYTNTGYANILPVTPVATIPEAPGLTRLPRFRFTVSQATTSVWLYSDSACATSIGGYFSAVSENQLIEASVTAQLPSSGEQQVYAKAVVTGAPTQSCINIGSYRTGIHKIVAGVTYLSGTIQAAWACAIVNGGLKCWGGNNNGQLGTGGGDSNVPVQIFAEDSHVTDVALNSDPDTGASSTCAIVGGAVHCWGANNYGQLGRGNTLGSSIPAMSGITAGAYKIFGSAGTFCAIVGVDLFCWGRNTYGQVGDSTTTNALSPYSLASAMFSVGGSAAVVRDVSMANGYTCAVANEGVFCWGRNTYGNIGNNLMTGTVLSPFLTIPYYNAVLKIHASGSSTCAALVSGVKCWGQNDQGQLGTGNTTNSLIPTATAVSLSGVSDIITGRFTYALSANQIYSWGVADYQQMFQGNFTPLYQPTTALTPTVLPLGYSAGKIFASTSYGMVEVACISINGGLHCHGNGSSSIFWGVGNGGTYGGPVIAPNSGVVAADVNRDFGCAAVNFGASAQCWGRSTYGQLGNGFNIDSITPVAVVGLVP